MHLTGSASNLGRMRCGSHQRSVMAYSRALSAFPSRARRDAAIRPHRVSVVSRAVVDAPALTNLGATDTSSLRKRPPIYKVMLHNDEHNRREYVVKVLIKVVEGFSVDDAMQVMEEAHQNGVAMVVACPQDEAEAYCEDLRVNGLASSIEPGC